MLFISHSINYATWVSTYFLITPSPYISPRIQKFTSVLSDTPADLMPVPSLDVVAQEFIDRRVRQEHEEDMITTDSARTILRLQDELNTSIASANLAYSTLGTSLKVREIDSAPGL